MRKLIDIIGAAALSATLVGCSTMPSVSVTYACASSIGTAAGIVANQCDIGEAERNAVVDIMNVVSDVVPQTNETFAAAWTPIAQSHTDRLIAEGKIDAEGGKVIMAAFNAAAVGIDYVFYRYPKAAQYKDLTSAAVDGFVDGFLIAFKPVNSARGMEDPIYDATALRYIRTRCGK